MNLRSRLFRLEQVTAARGMRELPILTLTELWDEPGVFTEDPQSYQHRQEDATEPPERYTEADFPGLEKRCRLILVCWDQVRQVKDADHRGAEAGPQW